MLPDAPADSTGRPYVAINMVSTVDGKVTLGTSAGGIGSRADRRLMRRIRAAVDGIVFAGGTLRADLVDPRVDTAFVPGRLARGASAQPLAIGVSGSLAIDAANRFLVNGPAGTVIFTTEQAPESRRRALAAYAQIRVVGGERVDLSQALSILRADFGVRRLLCEGGPSLNQQLVELGLVDELFWTVAPKLAGGRGRTLLDGPDEPTAIRSRLRLVSLFEEDGELFARYAVVRAANP